MRLITAFALSFLFAAIVGTIIFPAEPPVRSKPLAKPVAAQARSMQQATDPYVLLPAPPSSTNPFTSTSEPYEAAQQMMLKGRLREAQNQYLQILLAKPSIDQQAFQGLTRVQGLLAHGDVAALQQQAETYRRRIARGSDTEAGYSPKALELLAEADLLAAQDIQAEQAPKSVPIGSTVPVVSGIPQNTLSSPLTASRAKKPAAPPAIVQQVVRITTALNPAAPKPQTPPAGPQALPAGPQALPAGQPASADPSIAIPVPTPGTAAGSSTPPGGGGGGVNRGGAGSSGGWGGAGKSSPGAGQGGSGSSWGGGSEATPTTDKP